MSENPKPDREIFSAALDISDLEKRAAFVDAECAGQPDLKRRVETLLAAFANAGSFMETRLNESEKGAGGRTSTRAASRPAEGPGSIIGDYKLLQEIGEGGFGVVYMAEQFQPVKRKVALKIIKPGMDTREVVARFEAERQALALMNHPNIAPVLDAGSTETGRPFFVMELVKGIPINQFCDKNKLSTARRLGLFIDICGAIQHAHQKGVIHRDIKPSNILITLHDGAPVPKVIDFGIAKAINQELTEKTLFTAYGQMIGTPQYTSPEQAEMSGLDIDTRSDIYSLGVLLYELLTGETPISRREFKDAGFLEMQKLIQEKEPTKPSLAVSVTCRESTTLADFRQEEPSQLINSIKGDLDWIVLKALEKDRTRRYETAIGFAQDIRRYLDNEPVSASPPTLPYLLGKFTRRNKRLLAAVSAVFMALLLGSIGMTILYIRAKADHEHALTAWQTAEAQTRVAETERIRAEQAKEAEAAQRQLAQRQAKQIKDALAHADFVSGVELLARDEDEKALAHLARALRTDPSFLPAAQALVSALRDRNHHLDPVITLQHRAPITSFELSGNGSLVLTRAADGSVRLWDASTCALRKEFGIETPVKAASFSPDGGFLLTLSRTGVAQAWYVNTLQPTSPPISPDGGAAEIKAASGRDGGLVLATLSGAGCLQVWDGLSGQAKSLPLCLDEGAASKFELNDDGTRLLGQFGARTVACWNTLDGSRTGKSINLFNHRLWKASFAQDWLCRISRSGKDFMFHRVESGASIGVLNFEERMVDTPSLSHDESLMIATFRKATKEPGGSSVQLGADLITRIIDCRTARVVTEYTDRNATRPPVIHPASGVSLLRVGDSALRARSMKTGRILYNLALKRPLNDSAAEPCAFSPSGDRFVALMADNSFQVYRTLNGRLQTQSPPAAHSIKRVSFSPEGQRLVTVSQDETLRVWDADNSLPLTPMLHHTMFAGQLLFSRDGNRIFSRDFSRRGDQSNYGLVRAWNVREGRAVYEPLILPPLLSNSYARAEGRFLAVNTRDGRILLLHPETGVIQRTLAMEGKQLRLRDLTGGKLLAFSGAEMFIWDLETSKAPVVLRQNQNFITARFNSNGTRVATASQDFSVQVWDTLVGRQLSPPLPHDKLIQQIALSPDGSRLVTATLESSYIWNLNAPDPVASKTRIPGKPNQSYRVEFSPDGSAVLSTLLNKAQLWDANTGDLIHSFDHRFNLKSARFSPDGTRILVSGPAVRSALPVPGFVILWDIATRKQMAELPHDDQVLSASFAANGEIIVTLGSDNRVRFWHAGTGRLLGAPRLHDAPLIPRSMGITGSEKHFFTVTDGKCRLFPMPAASPESPKWLPELAETVAGRRLDGQGNLEMVPNSDLQTLREKLAASHEADDYSRFARWFVADRSTRPVSPDFTLTGRQLIERRIEEGLSDGLRQALRRDPTNATVFARLAGVITSGLPEQSDAWQSFPEWFAEKALQHAPHSVEAWIASADVLERRGKLSAGLESLNKALELAPDSIDANYLKAILLAEMGEAEKAFRQIKSPMQQWANNPAAIHSGIVSLRRLIAGFLSEELLDSRNLARLATDFARDDAHRRAKTHHAEWLSRLALELAPADPLVTVARSETLQVMGRTAEAAALMDQAIVAFSNNPEVWAAHSRRLAGQNRLAQALDAIDKSLSLDPIDPSLARRKHKLSLLGQLDRPMEARRVFLEMSIPKRSVMAGPNQIDLTDRYNASLTESWYPFMKLDDTFLSLSMLPSGLTKLDDVVFDVRGLIQLNFAREDANIFKRPETHLARGFPQSALNIKADGKWKTLHFLHAAAGPQQLAGPHQRRIGAYLVHFADGRTREIPIESGEDVSHWIRYPHLPGKTPRSTIAWLDTSMGIELRLYHSAWKNPWPDTQISHVDFLSSPSNHKPFLIAITGE